MEEIFSSLGPTDPVLSHLLLLSHHAAAGHPSTAKTSPPHLSRLVLVKLVRLLDRADYHLFLQFLLIKCRLIGCLYVCACLSFCL